MEPFASDRTPGGAGIRAGGAPGIRAGGAPRATLAIESPSVSRRYPGLARRLGVGALLAVLVPVLVALAAEMLHALTGAPLLSEVRERALHVSPYATTAAVLALIFGAVIAGMPLARPRPARLEVGPVGLLMTGRGRARAIPRAAIRDGLILPGYPARLTLWLAGGNAIDAEIPTESHGARLLAALGIGPERRRVAVSLWSTTNQIAAGFGVAPMAMILWWILLRMFFPHVDVGGPVVPLWLLAVVLTSALAWRAARPARVIVGRDGVRVERSFGTRWIPHVELAGAQVEGSRLCLSVLGAARPIVLEGRTDLVDLLARQIREAQARGAGGASSGTSALERQGRPIAAWREALRGLLAAESGYRAVALTPEDVIATLEDPVAPRDRRIGAALALMAAGHPEARERIRVAAEMSADEDMRAALAQAVEESLDEAALERALG